MTSATKAALLPGFYDASKASAWDYDPDQAKLFSDALAWAEQHEVKASATDTTKVHLVLIDVQKDFCFPKGSLYVGGRSGNGAVEDSQRIAEFIYRNLGGITDITCTMDTHFPFQIFSPSFWLDKDGKPLAPHTIVLTEQIKAGDVRPNPAVAAWVCNGNYSWLMEYVKHYTKSLEDAGKYQLYLWPYHCLIGSTGHALVGTIHEARLFHSFARHSASMVEVKGGGYLTENYSVLSPEVLKAHDGRPVGQRNTRFIETLLKSDAVIIGGQAASHCVKSSIDDLLNSIKAQDPKLAKKVYVMEDCMSAVAVPDGKGGFFADFTPQAEEALKKFADAGMNVVKSTVPLADWEGFPR